MKLLMIIDMQNGFVDPDLNELPVPHAQEIIPTIAKLQEIFANSHDRMVLFTVDCHPGGHCSFKEYGGDWPTHCIESTEGYNIVPELVKNSYYVVARKGYLRHVDSLSAFCDEEGTESKLASYLEDHKIDTIFVCGVATEYCVKANVLDALARGFKVFVIDDAIAGVDINSGDIKNARCDMETAGASFISSDDPIICDAYTYTHKPISAYCAVTEWID